MRKVLIIVLVAALLLSAIPAAVYAADNQVTGQGKGGNTLPSVTSVTLVNAGDDGVVAAMTPGSPYRVKVVAGDVNTIADITYIEFFVYHTSQDANWDADENAIFKWTKGAPSTWSMENGSATTTWEIVTIDCIEPGDFGTTTGTWYLKFKPGHLAQQDDTQNWKCSVKVYDEKPAGATGAWATGATMGAYSAVSFSQATITLGNAVDGIEPGQTGYITDPVSTYLTVMTTTNDEYALGVMSSNAWSDGSHPDIILAEGTGVPGGSGQFNLTIDNEQQGFPGQPKSLQAVEDTNVTIDGFETKPRVTTPQSTSEGTADADMYMGLTFSASGIFEVMYSGQITFTVTN
jgi:hypothetical protein